MKIFVTFIVLGLMNAVCFGRSVLNTRIEKRFNEAKYAFKFRVTSKATGECWPGLKPYTTQTTTTTTPTTTIASTADTTRSATTTNSVSTSTDRFTTRTATNGAPSTTNTANETPTQRLATVLKRTAKAETTPEATTKSSEQTPTESEKAETSIPTASSEIESSSHATTGSSQKLDVMSSTSPTKPSSPTSTLDDQTKTTDSGNIAAGNTTESLSPGRMKRSCQMVIEHQDIRIRKIFKGCDGIATMKRVERMNKRYLKSTIRLQIGFSELRPGRNYLFIGRAIPGQESSDHVFMADELTVLNWKPDAMKLKKYFKSKAGQC